jgi:hypothetical protein
MKTIIFSLLALVALGSCTEQEPQSVKEVQYTFNVTTTDNSKFQAVIAWSIDGVEYEDPMNAFLYASSFEISAGSVFVVNVGTDADNLKLTFYNSDSHVVKEVYIQPNTTYTFDHNLNY